MASMHSKVKSKLVLIYDTGMKDFQEFDSANKYETSKYMQTEIMSLLLESYSLFSGHKRKSWISITW